MGLEDIKEELKKQIEQADKGDVVQEEQKDVVVEEVAKEETSVETVAEETKKEESKPDKTPAEYAAERRDKRAMKEKIEELERQIADMKAVKETSVQRNEDPEPDPEDVVEHTKWQVRKLEGDQKKIAEVLVKKLREDEAHKQATQRAEQFNAAEREIQAFEGSLRQSAPDYDDVKKAYVNILAASIKNLSPNISMDELNGILREKIIGQVASYYQAGYENPVAEMYKNIKAQYQIDKFIKKPDQEDKKPDLAKVASNRSRNAGTVAGASASAGGSITPAMAATMTSGEWSKLPIAERKRIMSSVQ